MKNVGTPLRSGLALSLALLSACGFELALVGAETDGPGGVDASTSSSSSSSSGAGGSSGTSSGSASGGLPDAAFEDAATDAAAPIVDAAPDAPPYVPVCTPKQARQAFCAANTNMTCLAASAADPPVIPSAPATVGSAYFNDLTDTAPFDIALKTIFTRTDANNYGVVALFFGGDPAATTDLCTRLEALVPGEAAVLYWRQDTGVPTSARIVTAGEGCGDRAFEAPYRGDGNEREVHVVYDGANLTISGDGLSPSVSKAVTLSPQLRVGVVGQRYAGSAPPLAVEHVLLTCPSD